MKYLLFLLVKLISTNVSIVNGSNIHARFKRNNIPCGTSFTPCSRSLLSLGIFNNVIG